MPSKPNWFRNKPVYLWTISMQFETTSSGLSSNWLSTEAAVLCMQCSIINRFNHSYTCRHNSEPLLLYSVNGAYQTLVIHTQCTPYMLCMCVCLCFFKMGKINPLIPCASSDMAYMYINVLCYDS